MNFTCNTYVDGENYTVCQFKVLDNKIILSGEKVADASYVRYGWKNYGIVKIYNAAGNPLAPFGPKKIG